MKQKKNTRQLGVSLVELMVGLVLSLIVLLGMISTFTTLGRSTIEAKLGALNDSKVTTALLTVDRLLQGVGFGLYFPTSSYGTSIQVFDGISPKNVGEKGNVLVWKVGVSKCSALIGGKKLEYLDSYTCSSVLNVPSTTGIPVFTVGAISLPNAPNSGLFSFEISELANPSLSCKPFGIAGSNEGGKYIAIVTAGLYSGSDIYNQNYLKNETCLFNIK